MKMKVKNIFIVFCILYVITSTAINYVIVKNGFSRMLKFYESHQEDLLDYVKMRFEDLPQKDTENPEAIDKLLKFNNIYGFLYKGNMVIYEMDLKTTESYKNSTTRELFNDYSMQSGTEIVGDMTDIIFKDEGTAYITKNNKYGKEMVSWKNVEKNGENYVIGAAIPLEYIMEISNFKFYRNVVLIVGLMNYIIILGLCFILKRTENKLTQKNKLIN